jgi:adenine phosphoribosyltransferase
VTSAGSDLPATLQDKLHRLIRDVPDFPKPGVLFKDISPLLADHEGFTATVDALSVIGREAGRVVIDKVVGIEARGFLLAAPVALALGAGFVPVRKEGKLPSATYDTTYALEYGDATLQLHCDALQPGERVLIVDDVLATGGTLEATIGLVRRTGADVVAVAVLIELGFLHGRDRLGAVPLRSLLLA